MKQFSILFFISCLWLTAHAQVQPLASFRSGDKIIFVGNSITHGGHYHSYIWLYYMTRFPDTRITVLNAGIGGEDAGLMYKRLDKDIIAKNPNIIALTFGMNDTGYDIYLGPEAKKLSKEKIDAAHKSFMLITERLKKLSGVRMIMLTSAPYDETAKIKATAYPGKHAAMKEIIAFQEAAARENKWGLVDMNEGLKKINEKEQQRDPAFTLCGGDRIHPGADGHLAMACIFLEQQGFAGKEVADISLNAAQKKQEKAANCVLSNLSFRQDAVSFDYLAKALPFPIDTIRRGWDIHKQSDILPVIPFMEQYNREMLTVKGLPGDEYVLRIDGTEIGKWSGQEFAKGINLAAQLKTPQYQQALKIMELNEKRWEMEVRFRDYAWLQYDFFSDKGLLHADTRMAVDTLRKYAPGNPFLGGRVGFYEEARLPVTRTAWQEVMDELVDEIYTINKPKTHHIEIASLK